MLLKNYGNYDSETDTKADITIKFIISDIDKYNMVIKNSHDLMMEFPINICDALTGYSMYWDTHPDSIKYYLKFQDVIKDGDIKFIKGLGLPNKDNEISKRGKLYIQFKYIYPHNILDNDSYKSFTKIKDTKVIENKDSYVKEKIYDIKDDKIYSDSNNHGQRGQRHQRNGEEVHGCTQS